MVSAKGVQCFFVIIIIRSTHVETTVLLQRETLQKSLDLGTFPAM